MMRLWQRRAGLSLRDVRLACGLVIAAFVLCHLVNHALGLVSLAAMEGARPWLMGLWRTWPGQLALYGALATHAALGFYALARRRVVPMPLWEAAQLLLGLAIPALLLPHIVKTGLTRAMTDVDIGYPEELNALWVVDPWMRLQQALLLVIVWSHLAMGLHYWLRLKPRYRKAQTWALVAYVVVPLIALLGFAQAGMRLADAQFANPGSTAAVLARALPADPGLAALRTLLIDQVAPIYLAGLAITLVLIVLARAVARRRSYVISYPDSLSATAPLGMSILDASRAAGRPHMSVCGGRARCTTCRVRIDSSSLALPPPGHDEARALARIRAPSNVRLACQLRPTGSLGISPLLQPNLSIASAAPGSAHFGEERVVTVLFVDLRGSMRLAETRLPFDIVFLLNAFLEEMALAVAETRGHYSNFTGDGLMALFGTRQTGDHGADAALHCALKMLERLERLNARLAAELDEPLRIGIGIHTGEAIVGRVGPPGTALLSALGDTVNTASRLESATKDLNVPLIVSATALAAANIAIEGLALAAVPIRGRQGTIEALACDDNALRALSIRATPRIATG